MRPRQDLIDQFSTFLRFASDRPDGWIADAYLRRSMEIHLAATADQSRSEAFWATYWHQQWLASAAPAIPEASSQAKQQAVSQFHLCAYLQEVCYWAAQRFARTDMPLFDCFQIAIAKVPKILKACNPNHCVGLKTYSRVAFSNIIRDGLRRQQQTQACSDWALLLRVSRKQLHAALQQAGFSTPKMAQTLRAWQCYRDSYAQRRSKPPYRIQRPTAADWAIVVQCYRQHDAKAPDCHITDFHITDSHITDSHITDSHITDSRQLEEWLLEAAQQVRIYLCPPVLSLNVTRVDATHEWQDELAAPTPPPLSALIEQEDLTLRQEQRSQLNAALTAAIAQLDPPLQQLLVFYYTDGNTQQQIAERLQLPQYTVSRRLAKAREKLLQALGHWSQATLHIVPTSTVMNSMSALLEDWLSQYQPCSDGLLAGDNPSPCN